MKFDVGSWKEKVMWEVTWEFNHRRFEACPRTMYISPHVTRTLRDNPIMLRHGDCTAPLAPYNDVGWGVSAPSASSVRANEDPIMMPAWGALKGVQK